LSPAHPDYKFLSAPLQPGTPETDTLPWRFEVARKTLHALVVVLPILMLSAKGAAITVMIFVLAAIAVAADLLRAVWPPFGKIIEKLFGRMMRPTELSVSRSSLQFNSATLLLVGFALSVALFGAVTAAHALLIFLPSDAAAGLAGRRFGLRRWAAGRATITGTGAFILVGLAVALLLPDVGLTKGLIAVIAAAAVEAFSPVDDNLVAPFATAAILYFV
jgi:dolichol kinase